MGAYILQPETGTYPGGDSMAEAAHAARARHSIAHIEDGAATQALLAALTDLHPEYGFYLHRWESADVAPVSGALRCLFTVDSRDAWMRLERGDRVRGRGWLTVESSRVESVWPGDVICVADGQPPARLEGALICLEVRAPQTSYPAPRLALLRELPSVPGGCAAYPGAFRRQALAPAPVDAGAADRRGANRVNQHTLDMRPDRRPLPIRHFHGPVACGSGTVAHSETALVLSRSTYGLPLVDGTEEGEVLLFPQPEADPASVVRAPVRPGSIVVTPAAQTGVTGHCFLNAFAMLVAVPGFVSPYRRIDASTAAGGRHPAGAGAGAAVAGQ